MTIKRFEKWMFQQFQSYLCWKKFIGTKNNRFNILIKLLLMKINLLIVIT